MTLRTRYVWICVYQVSIESLTHTCSSLHRIRILWIITHTYTHTFNSVIIRPYELLVKICAMTFIQMHYANSIRILKIVNQSTAQTIKHTNKYLTRHMPSEAIFKITIQILRSMKMHSNDTIHINKSIVQILAGTFLHSYISCSWTFLGSQGQFILILKQAIALILLAFF